MVLALAYRSGVPWNESHYNDKEFDDLLTRAEGTLNVDERRAIIGELEKIMQDRGPMVQPLWRATSVFYDKRVLGFQQHPTGYIFGEDLAWQA
jgi:peptide/nickel transport system substrate-binding protein